MTIIADVPLQLHKHSVSPSAADSSVLPSLGNIASISSRTEKFQKSSAQSKKQRRYNLLDSARKILRNHNIKSSTGKDHRTRKCLAIRFDKTRDIELYLNDNPNESEASIQNLQTCRSICSCPVCAHRMMLEHAQDIKKALIYAENNGLLPFMLTLTAQHHKTAKLAEFKDNFKSSWRMFNSGRQWVEFKDTYGIQHTISAREVTRQRVTDNGWHYHMHVLLFVDKKSLMDAEAISNLQTQFEYRWIHCLNANGLKGIPEIACDVRAGSHVGEYYLTKLGLTESARGELDYELTGSANKGATIWDILDSAAWGDVESEYQYLEYVAAMTGENWITFSHGLRDLIKDIEVPVPQEHSQKSKMSLFYWITQENWNIVVRSHAVGTLLGYAAKYREWSIISEFIEALKHERERKISIGICDNGRTVSAGT